MTQNRRRRTVALCALLGVIALVSVLAAGTASAAPSNTTAVDSATITCGSDEIHLHGKAYFHYEPSSRYDPNYNGEYHPMRQVDAELVWTRGIASQKVVAITKTDNKGRFDFCLGRNNISSPRNVFVRVIASNPAATAWSEVEFIGGSTYVATSELQSIPEIADTVNLTPTRSRLDAPAALLPNSQQDSTAFHLVDGLLTARQFIRNNTVNRWTRKNLRVIFPKNGTSYNPNSYSDAEAMWFENETFSRSQKTVYHEYGHAVMAANYDYGDITDPASNGQPFPLKDGCHWRSTKSNIGFALSEGWATYISAIVGQDWDELSYHTTERGPCRPYGEADTYDGHRVEGSVTNILWNVTAEGANDDTVSIPFDRVLHTFDEDHPQDIFDVYDELSEEAEDQQALDSVFLNQGVDVVGPTLSVAGGDVRTVSRPSVTITGAVNDTHGNLSRVQYQIADGSDPAAPGRGWTTIAGENDSQWVASFVTAYDRTNLTIRGIDEFGNNRTSHVTVIREDNVPAVSDTVPQDIDGDGLYADLDGDGSATVFDAITYYEHRESDAIRNHPGFFDFDGNGAAGTVFDAVALYERVSSP